MSDRIVTYLSDAPPLRPILERHGDYFRSETLTIDLHTVPLDQWNQVSDGLPSTRFVLDVHEVWLALDRYESQG